jgi:MOSC domain-containing protein YiiM
VRLEVTKAASPCEALAGSFLEGRFTRVSQKVHPGWSRMCARVLVEGRIGVGDTVRLVPAEG